MTIHLRWLRHSLYWQEPLEQHSWDFHKLYAVTHHPNNRAKKEVQGKLTQDHGNFAMHNNTLCKNARYSCTSCTKHIRLNELWYGKMEYVPSNVEAKHLDQNQKSLCSL